MKSGTDTEQSRLVTPPTPRVSADPRARDPRATPVSSLCTLHGYHGFQGFCEPKLPGSAEKKTAEFHNLVFFSVVSLGKLFFLKSMKSVQVCRESLRFHTSRQLSAVGARCLRGPVAVPGLLLLLPPPAAATRRRVHHTRRPRLPSLCPPCYRPATLLAREWAGVVCPRGKGGVGGGESGADGGESGADGGGGCSGAVRAARAARGQ